jgi:uncharacterized protein YbjT (DUF2867 family)
MRVAVLGGSGTLGRAIVECAAATHDVVAISRRAPASLPAKATHHAADVTSGEGLASALAGADVVIDSTNAVAGAKSVLVHGTRRVIEAAQTAGAKHFIGISIVGIDDAPFAYYRVKVAQEAVVAASSVPWSLLRATQFHELVAMMANGKVGVAIAPRGAKMQPVDVRDVAKIVVELLAAGPSGRVPDVAGPEVLEMSALFTAWKRALHKHRWVLRMPLPGAKGAFLRRGGLCNPERAVGTITFAAWLAERAR